MGFFRVWIAFEGVDLPLRLRSNSLPPVQERYVSCPGPGLVPGRARRGSRPTGIARRFASGKASAGEYCRRPTAPQPGGQVLRDSGFLARPCSPVSPLGKAGAGQYSRRPATSQPGGQTLRDSGFLRPRSPASPLGKAGVGK